jgi:hypothetical protein
VIGGDGLADDYELLSRGVPIFRILKATGRCLKTAKQKRQRRNSNQHP